MEVEVDDRGKTTVLRNTDQEVSENSAQSLYKANGGKDGISDSDLQVQTDMVSTVVRQHHQSMESDQEALTSAKSPVLEAACARGTVCQVPQGATPAAWQMLCQKPMCMGCTECRNPATSVDFEPDTDLKFTLCAGPCKMFSFSRKYSIRSMDAGDKWESLDVVGSTCYEYDEFKSGPFANPTFDDDISKYFEECIKDEFFFKTAGPSKMIITPLPCQISEGLEKTLKSVLSSPMLAYVVGPHLDKIDKIDKISKLRKDYKDRGHAPVLMGGEYIKVYTEGTDQLLSATSRSVMTEIPVLEDVIDFMIPDKCKSKPKHVDTAELFSKFVPPGLGLSQDVR